MIRLVDHVRFALRMLRRGSRVEYPFRNVRAANRIEWGRNVRIKKHAWFSLTPGCRVVIGDHTQIGRHLILAGVGSSIVIEENVLISERVFIAEANHGFEDISRPVLGAESVSGGPVRIGAGSWLGVGVCILPGVTIGRHCIIGANAVVTRDVPDYSIAAGSPARVIKRYDPETGAWRRADHSPEGPACHGI